MTFSKLVLLSIAAVVVFDAAASVASVALGFNYQYATIGSAAIYLALCFFASSKFGFLRALALGVVMGLTDVTLGWTASWLIGAGELPPGMLTLTVWLVTAAVVVSMGVFCGVVGGALGLTARRNSAA